MQKKLDDLIKSAKSLKAKMAAVVIAEDDFVIEGIVLAYKKGIIIPKLIGNKNKIISILKKKEKSISANDFEIIGADNDVDASIIAVKLAHDKKADIIIKGHIHTDILIHQLIRMESGLRTNRFISHIFCMEIKTYKKLIFITDAAININPDIAQKAQILQNAIDICKIIGVKNPKAAILSAVETVNPKIASTMDAAIISKMAQRGQITGGIVDGPLAFDNVISKKAAEEKGIKSEVSGDADIILVPNIESGNILFKDLEYLAGAKVAGIVVGLKVPVVLTSRSDNAEARLYSAAFASIVSENYPKFLEYKAWV